MRILVAEPLAPQGLELLRSQHEVDERIGLPPAELAAILPDYDALVVRSQVKVDAALIAAGRRLVVIGRAGVGVDNVDLEAATRAGITVVNAPTGNTISAAELTVALMAGLARRVAAADASMKRGEWKRSAFSGVELRGRTLGIIGLGKIGQAVAVRARAMEMTLVGHDPFVTTEQAANLGVELLELPALLERADVLTVHVPMTRATRSLIGAAELARLPRGAMVLNVARGGVYDETAVAAALHSGHLAGAAFDVYEHEPPTDSPLLSAPNTILTPHLGASTAEAQVRVAEEAAEQVLDVLDGRPARYAVNAPLLTPETARAIAPYLGLTETLGRLLAQFLPAGVRTLTLEIGGELARHDVSPLAAAALRGLLETTTTERVNLVNSAHLAATRGIRVEERKTPEAGAFASLVTLVGEADGRRATVAGTVGAGEPRLTRLDDYWLDMALVPSMLLTRHRDRPGTMGRIGLILGAADINISAMHLARSTPRGDALMLLALDEDVPGAVAAAVRADEAVLDAWVLRLGQEPLSEAGEAAESLADLPGGPAPEAAAGR
ncbi:MAG: phosphoglycerate dehydrogenase [Candidatus Limnocylindrales bacterium]